MNVNSFSLFGQFVPGLDHCSIFFMSFIISSIIINIITLSCLFFGLSHPWIALMSSYSSYI